MAGPFRIVRIETDRNSPILLECDPNWHQVKVTLEDRSNGTFTTTPACYPNDPSNINDFLHNLAAAGYTPNDFGLE